MPSHYIDDFLQNVTFTHMKKEQDKSSNVEKQPPYGGRK